MKKSILFLIVLAACALQAVAQEKAAPRSEFLIELSASAVDVKAGESREVTLQVNRSKAYSKFKGVLGVSSGLPQGVTVAFAPAQDVEGSSVVTITADATAKPGTYTLILNGTLQHKTKGATLALTVQDGTGHSVTAIH